MKLLKKIREVKIENNIHHALYNIREYLLMKVSLKLKLYTMGKKSNALWMWM